jgi:hypothetical protein
MTVANPYAWRFRLRLRLIDSGHLRKAEQRELEKQLATLNPFALRKEIRRLEDRLWSRREKLYAQGERETLWCPNYEATPPDGQEPFGVFDL